jgi:hypothetical protein
MMEKPNVKKKYCKWTDESMKEAVNAVMYGSLPISGPSQLFCVPFTMLRNIITDAKFVSAGLTTHLKDASGHLRIFNSGQENILADLLQCL